MAAGEEPSDAEDRIHAVVEPVRARWIAQIYRVPEDFSSKLGILS